MTTRIETNPHKWFIIAAVMLSTVMEILDTTIVTVSLPHMMGSLGADRDQISWVLTSYIVAAGMLMPLTGFLVNRLGSKRLLLINIIGFMTASALCGISTSLTEIVIFRLMQGACGASLVPLAQYILRESFPPEEQPKLMAIWGIGIMAAPIMGPALGGYITDTFNWRWIFYINVPICIINFFLVIRYIKQSPIKKSLIDWKGMILMLTSVGALQLFLDRGEVDDWFSSRTICYLFIIFIVTFVMFVNHCLKTKNPIITLSIFKDRNFMFGSMMIMMFGASFLACLALIPQMLETLYGYTSNLSGLCMAPRGIASGIMMAVSSKLMMKGVDTRWLISTGLLIAIGSTWVMGDMTLNTSMQYINTIGFIQGLGIGFFFMPLSATVYSTLPAHTAAEAAGLFSFGRNLGNAIGISLLTTFLDRETQANWQILGGHLSATNTNLMHWLSVQHLTINDAPAVRKLVTLLSTQANFVAYMHAFKLTAIILLGSLVMVLLMKPSFRKRLATEGAH